MCGGGQAGREERGVVGRYRAPLPAVRFACVGTLSVVLVGCSGPQAMIAPASPEAAEVAWLFWLMLAITTPILVLVTAAFLFPFLRRRAGAAPLSGRTLVIGGGVVLPALVLPLFAVLSYDLGVRHGPAEPADLVVEVIGHKFWWEVRYRGPDDDQADAVVSANEVRLPAGRRVRFEVGSADVIHSFWIPVLGGKIDMIPGRTNVIQMTPDAPGIFRGQCAEFCGEQHTHMAFPVVVMPEPQFAAWLERERRPASPPADAEARRGQEAFVQAGCGSCHAVRGTIAEGHVAPDLTHMGARLTLGAGMLDNTPAAMAGWIADAQGIKPGVRMPSYDGLDGPTLRALTAYLQGLR